MEKTEFLGARHSKTWFLTMTGLFAALGCVATMALRVPSPTGGYMNLGDTVVLLGAYMMGPFYGALAGGVGPAMADLLSGYAVYVPGTLVIKAVMGFVGGVLYEKAGRKNVAGLLACAVVTEAIMVVGYWLFDGLLMHSLAGSAAGMPSNLVQALFGIVCSSLLLAALRKSDYIRRRFPRL